MPLYEFRCEPCACVFERILKVDEQNKPACPNCGENKDVKKAEVCKSNFVLKGSGWYKNGTH